LAKAAGWDDGYRIARGGEGAGTGRRTVGSRMIEANGPDSRMAGGRTS
jgi:hypothetical protein